MNVRYAYGISAALLMAGAATSLAGLVPAGAQVAANDSTVMRTIAPRAGAPMSFADLTEKLQPAVVNISTTQRVRVNNNPFAGRADNLSCQFAILRHFVGGAIIVGRRQRLPEHVNVGTISPLRDIRIYACH